MNQQDPGRAYRRRADGEQAGRRQWQRYKRPATDEVDRESHDRRGTPLADDAASAPGRQARRGPGKDAAGSAKASSRSLVPWIAGTVAAAGVGAGVLFAASNTGPFGEQAPDPLPAEQRYAPILTPDLLTRLAAELEAATGSTQVLDVWFEDVDYVRISVPPKRPGDLADDWWWRDGTLERNSASKPPEGAVPFDLRDVDPAALVRLDLEARSRSDGRISDSIAKVQHPRYKGDHWIYLRVAEVDHGAIVLWSDLAGNVESDLVYQDWRDD